MDYGIDPWSGAGQPSARDDHERERQDRNRHYDSVASAVSLIFEMRDFLRKSQGTSLAQLVGAGGLIFTAGSRELLGSRVARKTKQGLMET